MEHSVAFPTSPLARLQDEIFRASLHTSHVDCKYDLLGTTILRKQEFDRFKKKQEEWVESVKASPTSFKNSRRKSKLPFLSDPVHIEKRVIAKTNRRTSRILGESTHLIDIKQKLKKQSSILPHGKPKTDSEAGNSTTEARVEGKKNHYAMFEFMVDKFETENLCTSNRVCPKGTKAAIKCFSCVKYDPFMQGHYCSACFQESHPHYRVPHTYINIDPNATEKQEWKSHMKRLENERKMHQYKTVVSQVEDTKNQVQQLLPKHELQERIKLAMGQYDTSKETITALRSLLPKELTFETAVTKLQSGFRMRVARVAFVKRIKTTIKTLVDPASGNKYYYNVETGKCSWTAPRLLQCVMPQPSKRQAAMLVQKAFRSKLAKREASKILLEQLEMHIDPITGQPYYFNTKTSQVSWTRPACLLESDVVKTHLLSKDDAAMRIQYFFRKHLVAKREKRILVCIWEKHIDADTGQVYFYNFKTNKTS